MKKFITIILSIYLFFMFLVYCGVFRNNNDPIEVTKYYFECIKNREGFLTYQISKPEFFNEDRLGELYKKFNIRNLVKIQLNLKEKKDNYAYIQVKFVDRDKNVIGAITELEKIGNRWLIKSLE